MKTRVMVVTTLAAFGGSALTEAQVNPAELASDETSEPAAIEFDGSYRLRYEGLNNSYRNGTDSDQLTVSRLLAHVRYTGDHWLAGVELQDSRAWGGGSATPLGTDDINVLTPLQYYLGWRGRWLGGDLKVQAGRLTSDLGSRRLLARNRFRNTLNNFEGLDIQWQPAGKGANRWRSFWYNPLQRNPGDRAALADNRYSVDRALRGTRFWGLYRESEAVTLYALQLDESDQRSIATRDRELTTLGFLLDKVAAANSWGYELEAAWQFGYSRSSTVVEAPLLDHRAGFAHADWRYQFNDALQSQFRLQLDYASGDRSASDDENNRFDTLYGARRFDFGPTGIYGAFARSNILSPGVRWQFQTASLIEGTKLQGFLGYRAIWLASMDDSHTSAGIAAGSNERFLGNQIEGRVQIPIGQQWQTEFGLALLDKGDAYAALSEDSAGDTTPTSYIYSQMTFSF